MSAKREERMDGERERGKTYSISDDSGDGTTIARLADADTLTAAGVVSPSWTEGDDEVVVLMKVSQFKVSHVGKGW